MGPERHHMSLKKERQGIGLTTSEGAVMTEAERDLKMPATLLALEMQEGATGQRM